MYLLISIIIIIHIRITEYQELIKKNKKDKADLIDQMKKADLKFKEN